MKLLFFTYDFPYPATSGGKMRAYNLLKFAREDNEIILFSFNRKNFEQKYIDGIKKLGISKIRTFQRKPLKSLSNALSFFDPVNSIFEKLYFSKEIYSELEKTVVEEKIDLIHFESFYTAFYINNKLKKLGTKLLFGEENIEHLIYQDYAKYLSPLYLKPFYFFESIKIKNEEQKFWKKADSCLAVLPEEAGLIEKESGRRCFVIPNGVDLNYYNFREKKSSTGNILFVGNFSYFPNVSAVTKFYNNVFKNIKEQSIIFTIIGKGSTDLLVNDPRIKKIEFVQDLREEYYKADVFIFPMQFGGGTNFKILEAMACGVPVVAFPDRIRGLQLEDRKQVMVALTTEDFIVNIDTILNDKKFANNLSVNARKLVEEKYSWVKIGKKLNKIWKEL